MMLSMKWILMADTNFKFCTACGRKVALNAQFCAGCGAALGAKAKSVQSGTAPAQQGLTAKEWCAKGAALYESGRFQEALPCFEKALKINPQDESAQKLKQITLENIRKTAPQKW
jgi:tetratricopeptide (TPR) repeat protein